MQWAWADSNDDAEAKSDIVAENMQRALERHIQ
jgi:hypothetical protein